MLRTMLFSLVLAAGSLTSIAAHADDDATEQEQEAPKTTTAPSKADPAARVLPATASDTARLNAFGQQGARIQAAHEAARTAAADAAKTAAADHRPTAYGAPNTHASSRAVGASRAAAGLDRAATASGSRARTR
jgi:hypothetical protein